MTPTGEASLESRIREAADAIRSADALLIGAGAGMGVDSGLPDFRGPEGFWKAYPAFRGRQFHEMSTPHWFRVDPALAWGFFGHRLNLYRAAVPHDGFRILRKWMAMAACGGFVFTSNVDGLFHKAGFAEHSLLECHGSIHFLQCTAGCGAAIFTTDGVAVEVDEATIRARTELPRCLRCGGLARPNVLMFNDWDWDSARTTEQTSRYAQWLQSAQGKRVVAIELGAGLAIPTVRHECERGAEFLVRINPRECAVSGHGIGLPLGAREALVAIDRLLM